MLKVKNISIKLGEFCLKNISFDVQKGEYFVVLGESGIGKSVLLEIFAGLLRQKSGSIILNNNDISNTPIQKRGVGLVYQDQALFPHLNVFKNIEYSLKCKKIKSAGFQEKINKIAKQFGVEHLLKRMPETLSLGEAQRVALARTLVSEPEILLLDEPLSSLDVQAKSKMRSLLRKINLTGQTIIHVTHDYEEAIALATRIAIFEKSSISQIDIPDNIFRHPKSEFAANLIGIKNFYKGELKKETETFGVFKTKNLKIYVATKSKSGTGNLILKSEVITISKISFESSAKNKFFGKIIDTEPARLGIEIMVDIGIPISALITQNSFEKMDLKLEDEVWINFKATSAKYVE